jgi:hypothetical protein
MRKEKVMTEELTKKQLEGVVGGVGIGGTGGKIAALDQVSGGSLDPDSVPPVSGHQSL